MSEDRSWTPTSEAASEAGQKLDTQTLGAETGHPDSIQKQQETAEKNRALSFL